VSLESRYRRFDEKVRLWGERNVERGFRRPSFIGLTMMCPLIVVFLVLSATR
jgi:hypothetical protein